MEDLKLFTLHCTLVKNAFPCIDTLFRTIQQWMVRNTGTIVEAYLLRNI